MELANPFAEIYRAGVIVQHLDLQLGIRVLDIGCSPGRVTIPIAKQVGPLGEAEAIDLQRGMRYRAQKKAPLASLKNIRLLQIGVGDGKMQVGLAERHCS